MYHAILHDTYMTQVSLQPLDKESEEKIIQTFHLILSHITQKEDMQSFLFTFLAPTEQLMLAKRLMVFLLIQEGYSDNDISAILHMTRMTIARLRYYIESRGEGYQVAWKIMQNEKLLAQIKGLLGDFAGYAARAAGGRV